MANRGFELLRDAEQTTRTSVWQREDGGSAAAMVGCDRYEYLRTTDLPRTLIGYPPAFFMIFRCRQFASAYVQKNATTAPTITVAAGAKTKDWVTMIPLRLSFNIAIAALFHLTGWSAVNETNIPTTWPKAACNGAILISWSNPAATLDDPAIMTASKRDDGQLALPIGGDGTFRRLTIDCPHPGTLELALDCPRSLQCWIGDHQILDEELLWRDPQRRINAVLIVPIGQGRSQLTFRVGPRSRHPQEIDINCPSRNRTAVMERIANTLPDVLNLCINLHDAVMTPCVLRFSPAQFRHEGTAFQRVTMSVGGGVHPALPVLSTELGNSMNVELLPRAGVAQYFLPVYHGDLPPLRQAGRIESRPEPVSQIAIVRQITITDAQGSLTTTMPVFEGHGRLAPNREFHELVWPTIENVLAAAPEPILPEQYAGFMRLYRKSWELVLELVRKPAPVSGLPNSYVGTAKLGFLNEVFMWDSCFTAMAYGYGWRALPYTATLDMLYSFQQDGGYISRESDVHSGLPLLYEPDFSPNPPMPVVAELCLARLTGDIDRLRQVYPLLADYHRWLQANRRLPDGTYWTTGLANGLDNSPSLGDGYPDLTAQMAHAAECLSIIADILGKTDEAQSWRDDYASISHACNAVLWSEDLHFYSTSLPGGGHNPNKVVTGFWPLWAGIVPPDRVVWLAKHLKDPTSFWRVHPVPSLAADSPQFKPAGNYWLGSTWAPTNTAVVKGFQRSGRIDLARELTIRHLQSMLTVFDATGKLWENYCSEKDERGNQSGPDYSWTISGPIRLLIETLIGIEPDALHHRLRWTPMPHVTIGIKRFPLADATITLIQTANGNHDTITVTTDRSFILEMVDAEGHLTVHQIPAGTTQVP